MHRASVSTLSQHRSAAFCRRVSVVVYSINRELATSTFRVFYKRNVVNPPATLRLCACNKTPPGLLRLVNEAKKRSKQTIVMIPKSAAWHAESSFWFFYNFYLYNLELFPPMLTTRIAFFL